MERGTLAERAVLSAVTFSQTLLLVVVVASVLIFERRFSTARHWLISDWRESL